MNDASLDNMVVADMGMSRDGVALMLAQRALTRPVAAPLPQAARYTLPIRPGRKIALEP